MFTIEKSCSPIDHVNPSATKQTCILHFCLLGCETNSPYGPISHTAQLFADLLVAASDHFGSTSSSARIIIDAYNVQDLEYPIGEDEWSKYNGFLIPGSFSAAYDSDPWIQTLKERIQTHLVQPHRPTLGICFGHQVIAQSFGDGHVILNPHGARSGRFQHKVSTATGRNVLLPPATMNNYDEKEQKEEQSASMSSTIGLFYTHGDIVVQCPHLAQPLVDTDGPAWHALAYYPDESTTPTRPFAVSFQAHPEYAVTMDRGVERTLIQCMDAQLERGLISQEEYAASVKDSKDNFETVRKDSIAAIASVGRVLGWFAD